MVDRLRPHQRPALARLLIILARDGAALDCSDTGTGKTYVAAAVCAVRRQPTLIVVPKIAVTSWRRALDYMGTSASVIGYEALRTGTRDFGTWEHQPPRGKRETVWRCQSCQLEVDLAHPQPCYVHPRGIHCIEPRKRPLRLGNWIWHPAVKQIIFDEVHRCNALDSLNAELLIAARRQGIPTLGLSATPGTSPLHFRALGYWLGLHDLKGFPTWARRMGCRPDPRFHGWKWYASGHAAACIMADLHRELDARGVRLRTAEIPGFPARQVCAELVDLDQGGRIDRLYSAMESALAELRRVKAEDKAPDHPLTRILRARQEIELLKVPVVVELAGDYLAKGVSVAVFLNFAQSMTELRSRLKCDCVIHGEQLAAERQRCIDDFQTNRSKLILVNNKAGGMAVSLHDEHGGHPRVGLVLPTWSATDMKQVFGRLPREGGKSSALYRVLFAAGTVEGQIHRALSAKLNHLDTLVDGDLLPDNLRAVA